MANIEISTFTRNNDGNTYVVKDVNAIPKSGSKQISGNLIPSSDRTVNLGSTNYQFNTVYTSNVINHITTSELAFGNVTDGANISLCPKEYNAGFFRIQAFDGTTRQSLNGYANGTLTWNGQPIQYVSDQRYKQQINAIDDKLLDAWEDVEPVQFKYNDAVDAKKDNARLHTGYVVQQIDSACKSHNIDISEYGLYCHEEYPERTEEVEVQNEDGTTKKETKVIEEAKEHYSLRYTEVLVVECAYLRKKNKDLENTVLNLQTEITDLKSVIAGLKTAVQEIARK